MPTYRIAVDVGGTYTDCVAVDETGQRTARKAPTTPADRTIGVIESLRAVAADLQLSGLHRLLVSTTRFVHGSTVATNVMVERRGARTALLTTRGHEDALFIGRGRQRVAGLSESEITHVTQHHKPVPLIPRTRVVGLTERIDSTGAVLQPLDGGEVEAVLRRLADGGVEALAVCMLWSITNPAHERLVRDIAAQARGAPLYVSLSSEVAPVLGEYERLTSTVINAYIGPAVTAYTTRLEAGLQDAGLAVPILFTQANGGLATSDSVQDRPIVMLDSGPAAGVRGVAAFSSSITRPDVLCVDVGGTTFDVGVVTAGRPEQDEFPVIDQFEFRMPKILVKSIGAGGGSIAWLDGGGLLRVGPQSAGASPGPASYRLGGTEPTVTDAYLLLGYLDASMPLASGITLDPAAARQAVSRLAHVLGWAAEETAAAIVRISENQMGDLIHRVTLERGLDPRDFALAIYGGAGPMYAASISDAIGIRSIHIMPDAGSFSALGMLSTDLVWSATTPVIESLPFSDVSAGRVRAETEQLTRSVEEFFGQQGISGDALELSAFAGMRFALQAHHLNVPLADLAPASLQELPDDFITRYENLYGKNSVFAAAPIEIMSLTVTGISRVEGESLFDMPRASGATPRPAGQRQVHFHGHGRLDTSVYRLDLPGERDSITGPAIIHRSGDTIAIPPGWLLSTGRRGDLVLRRPGQ
jgi:N-methylhydantoinase A/oxoprolinase/acetone carboxylase beta subunit